MQKATAWGIIVAISLVSFVLGNLGDIAVALVAALVAYKLT